MGTKLSPVATTAGVSAKAAPIVGKLFERAHAANVSMLAVCRHAKVHHDVVGRWRRGDTSPTVRTLEKIIASIEHFEKNRVVVPL